MATTVANFYNKKGPSYATSADGFARQALSILDPADPANDVLRGNALTAFGKALRQEGYTESADEAQTNATNFNHIADAKFAVSHDVSSNSWNEYTPEVSKLAQAYASAGDYQKADETFQEAIKIHQQALQGGPDEANPVKGADVVYLRYAAFLKANGRGDEAKYYQNLYAQEHKAAQ
jgi:tetratricopeptide (TPR) repeat protein